MNQHTQEPWEAFSHCPGQCCWELRRVGTDSPFDQISNPEMSEQDAKRIAACVNACEGLSNEDLIKNGFKGSVGHILTSQLSAESLNTDLVCALYKVLPFIEDAEDNPVYKPGIAADLVKQLKALIKRAEG